MKMHFHVEIRDNFAISSPPSYVTSIRRRGQYIQVEVWSDKRRYKLSFTKSHNLVSIHCFIRKGEVHTYLDFWHWRQEFNRDYKRKGTLKPLHIDIVCCALEAIKGENADAGSRL